LAELTERLKPNAHRLAVLSACRTNLVGAALPNELVGLPSALLRPGVPVCRPAVLGGLRVHRRLSSGDSLITALDIVRCY